MTVTLTPEDHYLVIGGSGFLGKVICKMLLDRHEVVSIFDLHASNVDPRLKECIIGDISKPEDVSKACKDKTVVIHTASPVPGKFPNSVYFKVNVEGTRNVIHACMENNVPKLVYTSSASVTYDGTDLVNATEKLAYCKVHMDALGEAEVIKYNGQNGLATCALRPSGIFGPADTQASYGVVEAARKGNWRIMIGDNQSLFDLTYVDNVAHAHILAADKLALKSAIDGQIFTITNDQPILFWDFPKYFHNHLGYRETQTIQLPTTVGYLLGDLMDFFTWILKPIVEINPTLSRFKVKMINSNRFYDISKAKEILGYKPIVSLEDAFRITADYWKHNGYAVKSNQ
ncbi:hypothetical protein HDV02_006394 [Globomyces sp. JEL0801]|nr:hypothetical protein HDV02_006394 [Globomyces sp. JEL0801]